MLDLFCFMMIWWTSSDSGEIWGEINRHLQHNFSALRQLLYTVPGAFQVHSKFIPRSLQGHSKVIPSHYRCIPSAVQVHSWCTFCPLHWLASPGQCRNIYLISNYLLHWQCGGVVVHIPNASSHWQCIPKCSDLPVQQRQQQRIPRPLMGVWQAGQSGPRLLL